MSAKLNFGGNKLIDNQHFPVSDEFELLFKNLMRLSTATLCDSVFSNNDWKCGSRCDSNVILLRTLESKNYNGRGFIVHNRYLDSLVVAFKGSKSGYDYYLDSQFLKSKPEFFPVNSTVQVHSGFLKVYNELRSTLIEVLQDLLPVYGDAVYFTGHSLGGALATLAAIDFYLNFQKKPTVVTFGQPRIGNYQFASWVNSLDIDMKRIAAKGDIVPFLPPKWSGYQHSLHPFLHKQNETFRCVPDCNNSIQFDFKIHATGYFGWNTTIINC